METFTKLLFYLLEWKYVEGLLCYSINQISKDLIIVTYYV